MKNYHHSVTQKQRIPLIVALFVLLTFSVIARLFYLQVYKHADYVRIASAQHSLKDTIPARRGSIYAEDTVSGTPYVLASNQTLNLLYIDPKQIADKDQTLQSLSQILGMSVTDLEAKYDAKQQYIPIMHKLTDEQSKAVTAANLKGVGLQPENWRYYPENNLASALLGFVNNEGAGNYGIEGQFDDILTGKNGFLNEETDSHGIQIAFGNNGSIPAVDGTSIYLTVDRYIQGKAEEFLNDTLKKFSADSGQVIVMDKTTGKILAMANGPSFDPNKYKDVKDYSIFKNKAVSDVYEPGSIFKAATLAAGLDSGKIKPDDTYTDYGYIVVDGTKISNSTPGAHGACNMSFILEQSLNTGTTFVEQKVGNNGFYDYVKKFGFGAKTGIELGDEAAGKVYSPDEVGNLQYVTMSFGQGISTTPLQMIQAYAAIANAGKLVQPMIIEKTVDASGKTVTTKSKTVRQVISEETARETTQMLINVVEKGHGKQAAVKGYKIAGKTGTAQVVKEDGTGYETNKNIGSFVGYPVAENANFVVMAKIDNPKGVQWAESTAAPLVGQMLDYLLKYYQIPPTEK